MNESRQTVETDTLWLSNIRALNFRKPGHLRKKYEQIFMTHTTIFNKKIN